MTPSTISEIETGFARELNAAKHKTLAPETIYRALNIPTALIGEDITVTYGRGQFWAGTRTHEFCWPIGTNAANIRRNLDAAANPTHQ